MLMKKLTKSNIQSHLRRSCLLGCVLFTATFSSLVSADFKPIPEESLQTTREMQIDLLVSLKYLKKEHYKDVSLDDELSKKTLDRYLDFLDPNRVYFYASDIAEFRLEQFNLDNQFSQGNPELGFDIYKVLRKRVREREDYANQLLETKFNFNLDESFTIDRSESAWPETQAEMNDLWRKRVKNAVIIQKLDKTPEKEIRTALSKRYARQANIVWQTRPEEVFELYLNALMREVGPHTQYMSRVTAENFRINLSLSLEGIGASLQSENDYTVIRKVIAGGPASKSGKLSIDDKIVGVGQSAENIEDVTGWRLMDVVGKIRGKKGSTVFLQILTADSPPGSTPETVELIRDVISLEDSAAQLDYQEVNDKRFAVIEIPSFYAKQKRNKSGDNTVISTSKDVARLIEEAQSSGNIDGLIIDLRGNGGGYLREAINLTGLFIDQGPVVQVQSSDEQSIRLNDRNIGTAYDGPLAVLVDKSSASASEIFAGAIKDYGRGIIIGERTFGKGTVQTTQPLKRTGPNEVSSTLKLTIQQFFRVNGESTQVKGVEPDVILDTGNRGDFGEGMLDNALPWAKISSALNSQNTIDTNIDELKQLHLNRAQKSAAFTFLKQTALQRKINNDLKIVSLDQGKRTTFANNQEIESVKQINNYRQSLSLPLIDPSTISDANKDLPDGDKHWAKVFQKEAALILNDFLNQQTPKTKKLVSG